MITKRTKRRIFYLISLVICIAVIISSAMLIDWTMIETQTLPEYVLAGIALFAFCIFFIGFFELIYIIVKLVKSL